MNPLVSSQKTVEVDKKGTVLLGVQQFFCWMALCSAWFQRFFVLHFCLQFLWFGRTAKTVQMACFMVVLWVNLQVCLFSDSVVTTDSANQVFSLLSLRPRLPRLQGPKPSLWVLHCCTTSKPLKVRATLCTLKSRSQWLSDSVQGVWNSCQSC